MGEGRGIRGGEEKETWGEGTEDIWPRLPIPHDNYEGACPKGTSHNENEVPVDRFHDQKQVVKRTELRNQEQPVNPLSSKCAWTRITHLFAVLLSQTFFATSHTHTHTHTRTQSP